MAKMRQNAHNSNKKRVPASKKTYHVHAGPSNLRGNLRGKPSGRGNTSWLKKLRKFSKNMKSDGKKMKFGLKTIKKSTKIKISRKTEKLSRTGICSGSHPHQAHARNGRKPGTCFGKI